MEEHGKPGNPEPTEDQESQDSSDRITVGDIGEGAAVAVGRSARAITRIFNIDVRLLPVVVLLLAIVGVLAYLLLRPTAPEAMTSQFNVAVAEFIVVDQDGSPVRSKDGQALADFLFQRLQISFDELDLRMPYELWPPAYTGRIEGGTREERAQAAEALAQRIGVHVIIYGVITQAGDRSKFAPEFYINYKGFAQVEEIAGQHELGSPLRILLPFDTAQFQGVENPALSARVQALSLVTIGLSYYATDDFERALDYFAQAEATESWLQSAGKEVVYLLLGSASARLAQTGKSTEYLEPASDYYDTALSINPTYARAQIGRAGVLYLVAMGDPTDQSFDTVDLVQLDEAAAAFEVALDLGNPPESANIETKVHFYLGQIDLVRALILGEDWLAQAEAEFEQVVQEYESGNVRVAELAGQTHARLGAIALLQENTNAAVEHYTRATELVTPYYQAYYYTRLGEIYAANGQTDLAIESYAEAIQIAEFYGDQESAAKYAARLNELEAEE
jgi:tetratricopeptide (TPR) repeat protein